MKLALSIATALAALSASTLAQAPAAPPAAGAAEEKPKNTRPFSSSDVRAFTQIAEAMQFHIKMGETGKWRGRQDDPELEKFGVAMHKQMVALWTPLINMAQERKVDAKHIPAEPVKRDKDAIAKIRAAKGKKFSEDYYGLFAKEGNNNIRTVETALKSINDPDLKQMAEAISKAIAEQAQQAGAAAMMAKSKK